MAAPSRIDEYTLRAGTLDDAEEKAAMCNVSCRLLYGRDEHSPQGTRIEWSTPGFNPADDVRIAATPDGEMVGVAELWDTGAPHVIFLSWANIHPAHRRQGIGRRLMEWAEARAREQIDRAPAGARVALHAQAASNDHDTQAFLKAYGMQEVRRFWRMEIDLGEVPPAPLWPDGIAVRAMRGDDDADRRAVFGAVLEAFRDHWGHIDRPFEEAYARWRHWQKTDPAFDPGLFFVAEDGGEVAGFSLCWPSLPSDDEMGWVGTLGVRRPWRGRGLALALLRHSFRALHGRGLRQAGLGVDSANLTGATRLYERAGMHVAREMIRYEMVLRDGESYFTRHIDD
jgi:mycothiol synthase